MFRAIEQAAGIFSPETAKRRPIRRTAITAAEAAAAR
jgi:hypothetical protein